MFRPSTLLALSKCPQSTLEEREKLEQLRLLSGGIKIKVAVISRSELEPAVEVDTPDDLMRARKIAETVDGKS